MTPKEHDMARYSLPDKVSQYTSQIDSKRCFCYSQSNPYINPFFFLLKFEVYELRRKRPIANRLKACKIYKNLICSSNTTWGDYMCIILDIVGAVMCHFGLGTQNELTWDEHNSRIIALPLSSTSCLFRHLSLFRAVHFSPRCLDTPHIAECCLDVYVHATNRV